MLLTIVSLYKLNNANIIYTCFLNFINKLYCKDLVKQMRYIKDYNIGELNMKLPLEFKFWVSII